MDPYLQADFSGGMNLFDSDTGIAANEYVVGFNVRNRTGDITPINDADKDTDAPEGLKQGLYAFDKYLLLFNSGAGYYKDITLDGAWTRITDLNLNTDVLRIYTEAVPQSTKNNIRKLNEPDKINGTQLETTVNVNPQIFPGSLGGLVVQDGINQPYIIISDGTARKLKDYTQWSLSDREYVPVMKQMKFINGILAGVDPDGITIYRSVSGRPLDFVVNIDINGNKGGSAKSTSYAVSPFPITCLAALNSGELFIGTLKTCHPIIFNYESTIFAEPTFINVKTMAVGVTNHFSFIDTIGDYTFIDIDGLRSFNAVNNDKNEGRTSIFSAKLNRALEEIKQDVDVTCAVVFNNYSLYSIATTYGNVIAVFDNTRQIWVSLDMLTLDGAIKQFAVADQSDNPTVYAITASSVYRLYDSEEFALANIKFRAMSSGACSIRMKCEYLFGCFDGSESVVNVTGGLTVDNNTEVTVIQPLSSDNEVDVVTFNFQGKGQQGWKIQPSFSWRNDAVLNMLEMAFNPITSRVDAKQSGKAFL